MKNTAARSPATFVVPRYSAVKAHRKITQAVQPVDPINMNVLRPNRSMYNAVQMFPMMVNVVQQAFRSKGTNPVNPRDA